MPSATWTGVRITPLLSSTARWIVCRIPERILGPFFNWMRLRWKALSRPTKRKGLAQYDVVVTSSSGHP